MKTLTKTLATLVATFALAATANASVKDVVAADNYVTSQLCAVATQGNKHKMRDAIEASRLSKVTIIESVKCNDQDFLQFVAQNSQAPESMIQMMLPAARHNNVTITDLAAVAHN